MSPVIGSEGHARVLRGASWVAMVSALGCAASPGAPETRLEPRVEQPTDAGIESATVVDAGDDAADATLVDAEARLPKVDAGLHVVAIGDLKLAPLENAMLVHDIHGVGRLEDGNLVAQPDIIPRGRDCNEWITTMHGRWPDSVFVAKHQSAQGTRSFPGALLYRWSRGRWTRLHPNKERYSYYTALVPWDRGGVAGAMRLEVGMHRTDIAVARERYSTPFAPTVPANFPTDDCETELDAFALASVEGSLLAAGVSCLSGDPAVERFERGRKAGVVERLPRPDGARVAIRAIDAPSATDVYVGGGIYTGPWKEGQPGAPYLAHYDGKQWEPLSLPISGEVTSIQVSGGTLWLAAGGRLWKGASGTWSEVALSAGQAARRVVVRAPGDIWVETNSAILRSIAPSRVAREIGGCTEALAGAPVATPSCQSVFVVIAAAPADAPVDYAYPEVRAALEADAQWKGLNVYETSAKGRRYVGAYIETYADATRLAASLRKQLRGASPRLVCAYVTPTRYLDEIAGRAAGH